MQISIYIEELMKQHNLIYQESDIEIIAHNITELAGDVINHDQITRNIYTLYSKGLLNKEMALNMYFNYYNNKYNNNMIKKRIFDPFNNYEDVGYLNNVFHIKNMEIIKTLEHATFLINLPNALNYLSPIKRQDYNCQIISNVHKILFNDFYPWAGQFHNDLFPDLIISKGHITFAFPDCLKNILNYTFNTYFKQSDAYIRKNIGDIISSLCYAHPFLDGNGRTILTILHVICQNAGFHINWSKSKKDDYLDVLTEDLEHPNNEILNKYLSTLIEY